MAQIKAIISMLQNLCHCSYYSGRCLNKRGEAETSPLIYYVFFLNLSLKTFLNLSSLGAITNEQ